MLAVLLGAGFLYAQDEPPADDADAPAEGEPDVTVPMETQAELSPEEMIASADKLIKAGQKKLVDIVRIQRQARMEKDIIKLNCVNDKLLQVKQLLNIAEAANTNMHEAIAQEDEEGRYHEYSKIVIATQKIDQLTAEAGQCIGEEAAYLGDTTVEANEPPIDDPSLDEPEIELEPPGYASPFA